MSIPTIDPKQLKELYASGRYVDLIDVRTPAEYCDRHVAFARNVPLDQFNVEDVLRTRCDRPDQPLYIVCQSGSRGRQACERLIAAGYPKVVNVEGGTAACADADLPLVRGKKAMSLERQVRISAGILVVLGTSLGWLIHPACAGLSAFIGAGLIFAGITDTCGMGMILARMPWNRCSQDPSSCRAP
jgi:rhodanese-related sulfurtransferase